MANQAEAIQAWNKYISPDFDPSLLGADKRQGARGARIVRMVTPFKCACLKCGAIIPHMKKFNTRIEKAVDKDYHGVIIFRFFYRCPECSQPFTIVTDPSTNDYAAEHGVRRIMEVWKDEQLRQKKLAEEKAARDELGGADTMEALEERTARSKRLMEQHEELEALKTQNRELEAMTPDEMLNRLYGAQDAQKAEKAAAAEGTARTAEEEEELAAAFGGGEAAGPSLPLPQAPISAVIGGAPEAPPSSLSSSSAAIAGPTNVYDFFGDADGEKRDSTLPSTASAGSKSSASAGEGVGSPGATAVAGGAGPGLGLLAEGVSVGVGGGRIIRRKRKRAADSGGDGGDAEGESPETSSSQAASTLPAKGASESDEAGDAKRRKLETGVSVPGAASQGEGTAGASAAGAFAAYAESSDDESD